MIERITNEAFDERFYRHSTKLNSKTGNNFFPAYHFVLSMGAPESIGLSKWRQDKGHFADHILRRSAEIGSYVHDCIDRMIKTNTSVTHDEIDTMFPDVKEAHKAREGLLGFLNFMQENEPEILSSEHMGVGDDFGFTLDLKARIKFDDYKHVWVLDWKTSKVVSEDHLMQVETIRRVVGAEAAGVIVLGNTTKKKYTFTPVKPSKADYLYNRFLAIKETAYVEMLERGLIQPREDNMPLMFSLKEINIKRSFDVST